MDWNENDRFLVMLLCRYLAARMVGTLAQFCLRVGFSMSIRSVATYIEAVTRLLFVFGCTERRAQVVSLCLILIWTTWTSG